MFVSRVEPTAEEIVGMVSLLFHCKNCTQPQGAVGPCHFSCLVLAASARVTDLPDRSEGLSVSAQAEINFVTRVTR